MSGERKAVITVRENRGAEIEFFPEVQRGGGILYELLGLIGFMVIAKANREREVSDCES